MERDAESRWQWLLPSVIYAVLLGFVGVTTKLLVRDLSWQVIFVWATMPYVVVALGLVFFAGTRLSFSVNGGYAALSGLFAALGLVTLIVALGNGEASLVVPIGATYPLVTTGVAVAVLSERVTRLRVIGTVLVVIGVAILGSQS